MLLSIIYDHGLNESSDVLNTYCTSLRKRGVFNICAVKGQPVIGGSLVDAKTIGREICDCYASHELSPSPHVLEVVSRMDQGAC